MLPLQRAGRKTGCVGFRSVVCHLLSRQMLSPGESIYLKAIATMMLAVRRIAVIGCGGAGKSTLSRRLGECLGLPVIHLDRFFWQPDWVATPDFQWRPIVERLATADQWIIDGNYLTTLDIRLKRADTIIWLDFRRMTCMYRAIKRIFQSWTGSERADMADGCAEKLDWEFLEWIWDFPQKSRPKVLESIQRYAHARRVVILHSPNEIETFLANGLQIPL